MADTKSGKKNHALRYLWARNRISLLANFNYQPDQGENQAEITSLGLTYNLLTPFTSFIAVHEVVRDPEAKSLDVKQPLPLPLHVSNLAVGGGMTHVPEPEFYLIVLALLGLLTFRYRYRRTHPRKA